MFIDWYKKRCFSLIALQFYITLQLCPYFDLLQGHMGDIREALSISICHFFTLSLSPSPPLPSHSGTLLLLLRSEADCSALSDEKVIGCKLQNSRQERLQLNPSHPGHRLLEPLASGIRLQSIRLPPLGQVSSSTTHSEAPSPSTTLLHRCYMSH